MSVESKVGRFIRRFQGGKRGVSSCAERDPAYMARYVDEKRRTIAVHSGTRNWKRYIDPESGKPKVMIVDGKNLFNARIAVFEFSTTATLPQCEQAVNHSLEKSLTDWVDSNDLDSLFPRLDPLIHLDNPTYQLLNTENERVTIPATNSDGKREDIILRRGWGFLGKF